MMSICTGVILAKESFKPPLVFVFSSWALTVFIGIYLVSMSDPKMDSSHFQHRLSNNSIYGILILREMNSSNFYSKYLAKVISVNCKKSSGFVWLRVHKKKGSILLKPGARIVTNSGFGEIQKKRNPGEFDYKDYSRKNSVRHELTLENNMFVRIPTKNNNLATKALNYRDHLSGLLNQLRFDPMERSLVEALLLGRKTALEKELSTGYRRAGAMHLLAISGLHVGILLMIIRTLLKPFRRWHFGSIAIKVIPFLSLWVFAFITGLSASVSRAVIMFSLVSIALNVKRFNALNPILFTAFFISLLWKPLYLFDAGFQLSYLAVFSIVNLGPRIKVLWRPKNKVGLYLWNLIVVSIAAQIGVLPLILYYFHEFSGLFLISSLFLIPLLGVILGAGYLLLVMLQCNVIPELYFEFYSLMIRQMNKIVFYLSRFDSLIIEQVFFSKALLSISILALIALFFYKTKEVSRVIVLLLLFVTLMMTSIFIESVQREKGASFIVFHAYRKSLILEKKGRSVKVLRKTDQDADLDRWLENYQNKFFGLRITKEACTQNIIEISGQRIMMIDSDAILEDFGFNPDVVILLNSPKINLKRFLKNIQPDIIVADGSNSSFLKQRWIDTAAEEGITFYDTAMKGAFQINE